MRKNTEELLHELKTRTDIGDYLTENRQELCALSLKEHLEKLLKEKHLTKAKVIADSQLHEIYAYQIFSGRKHPSRDKLLALAFGFGLSVEETQRLLTVAGVSVLYPRVQRDSIILFSLEKGLPLMDCNDLLEEMKEESLGVVEDERKK